MEQKGMSFDHDFCYLILLFSSLLKKDGREKENEVAKNVIKSHTFLFLQPRIPGLESQIVFNICLNANHQTFTSINVTPFKAESQNFLNLVLAKTEC